MSTISTCIAVFLIGGCSSAQRSSEVNAVYVPAEQYAGMSCQELYAAAEAIRAKTPALALAVDKARKNDKLIEAGGWLLFAPALLFMDGNAEEAAALASAKGQLDGIRTAGLKANCQQENDPENIKKDPSQTSPIDEASTQSSPINEASTQSSPIDEAGTQCADIGFEKGTEKYADCVMRIFEPAD